MQAFRAENSKYFKSTFDLEVDKPYLVYDDTVERYRRCILQNVWKHCRDLLLIMQ